MKCELGDREFQTMLLIVIESIQNHLMYFFNYINMVTSLSCLGSGDNQTLLKCGIKGSAVYYQCLQ